MSQERAYARFDHYAFALQGEDRRGNHIPVRLEQQSGHDRYLRLDTYLNFPYLRGVVDNRCQAIKSVDWTVTPFKRMEDEIAEEIRTCKEIMEENAGQLPWTRSWFIAEECERRIRQRLPDLLFDFSNYDQALARNMRKMRRQQTDSADQIREFYMRLNNQQTWAQWVHGYMADKMIHGRAAGRRFDDGRLMNFPGGTLYRIRSERLGEWQLFIQYASEFANIMTPQIFYEDEVYNEPYIINSFFADGLTPIDALILIATEVLKFDEKMVEWADDERPPDKLVAFGRQPQGLNPGEFPADDPLPPDEQRRIEYKLNERTKDGPVATVSGVGTPMLLDLTGADTFAFQQMRSKDHKNLVGLLFQATPMELNEAGSADTSGRNTSDAQADILMSRGVMPLTGGLEDQMNLYEIPRTFGPGWVFRLEAPRNVRELIENAVHKMPFASINQIREEDFGWEPYPEADYSRPQAQTAEQQTTEGLQGMLGKALAKSMSDGRVDQGVVNLLVSKLARRGIAARHA
jgi:hypothetical protein